MTDTISRRWVKAAIQLANDRKAMIVCPNCGGSILQIDEIKKADIPIALKMSCSSCHKQDVMNYSREGDSEVKRT